MINSQISYHQGLIFCGIQGSCNIQAENRAENRLETLPSSHLFVILAQH
jgi:hypothetical protein